MDMKDLESMILVSNREGELNMNQTYFVSKTGNDFWEGSKERPFRSISKAADVAQLGDVVNVFRGTYREWVKPKHGGYSDLRRITYQPVEGEKVIIKGSEIAKEWESVEGSVWKYVTSNTIFGDYNPYATTVDGDWMLRPKDWRVHAGDVYLNGKSFYEARTLEDLKNPVRRDYFEYPGNGRREYHPNPEETLYQWYAVVEDEITTIYANFQSYNPNEECVEINVRRCCFYPDQSGLDYITVRGFEMAHSANGWAPPTTNQYALLGPKWSKGWIIEDNIIHDAKCIGIGLGKESSTGDMLFHRRKQKSGYHYQMDSVFRAIQIGWSKETIGSHVVRNNTIYDCGQKGIGGHLGCAFSKIYGNHIYNIGIKQEFFGWDIAGIKFLAPVDTQIYGNRVHDCTLGFWMDWEAQGTRISGNLFYNNHRDGNIEVTHGPLIIDNNIFADSYGFDNHAQGTAFVNNLLCGRNYRMKIFERATPMHFPHTTAISGYAFVYGGDERYYGNIFVGDDTQKDDKWFYGTAGYDEHPASFEEYMEKINAIEEIIDNEAYLTVEQPMYIEQNIYLNGAQAYKRENHNYVDEKFNPQITIIEEGDAVYLEFDLPGEVVELQTDIVDTDKLGTLRLVDTVYDDPDGNPITLDKDYFGQHRENRSCAGPFAHVHAGKNRIKIWN